MPIFKPTLFKNFEEKGEWWLPTSPNNKVTGTISFKAEDEISLELLGSFFGHEHFRSRGGINPVIILGLTNEGEKLTLYQNMQRYYSGSSSRGGTGTVIYIANYLIIGEHFNSASEMQFNTCSLNYSYLEEWIGHLPFETEMRREGDKFLGEQVTYTQKEGFKAQVPTLDATISVWHGHGGKIGGFRKLVLTHTAYLTVDPAQPQGFDWFLKVQFELRNLLSLFIGRPVYLKRHTFVIETEEKGSKRNRKLVHLYFTQRRQVLQKRINPMDVLISLEDVEGSISNVLEAWFSTAEKLEDVYQLFVGAVYSQGMYTHLHFLTLMQALETYHRSTKGGKYISESDYERAFAALIAAIPRDLPRPLRDSLRGRLKYGNEYSLRKRIKELLDELTENSRNLISKEPENFINSIIETRNYFTHYDESLKQGVLDGADLYNASLSLKIFLMILLLKELGIREETIVKKLSTNFYIVSGWVHQVEYDEDRETADQVKELNEQS